MVPKARWPALAERPRALHVVEQPGDLGGREVGVEQQAGLGRDRRLVPGRASASRHASAVRRSCQTMARWIGLPVRRSHSTQVSRWLVMPMAAMSPAREPGGGQRLPGRLHRRAPDVLGIVLDPARGREVLGELALRRAQDGQVRRRTRWRGSRSCPDRCASTVPGLAMPSSLPWRAVSNLTGLPRLATVALRLRGLRQDRDDHERARQRVGKVGDVLDYEDEGNRGAE